jgi:ABC-type lipoprotein release transport system permease subunit
MHALLEVAHTGLTAVLLHPLRSLVSAACLVAVLVPYLAGMGLSRGIEREAQVSVEVGADLYVTGEQFGRSAPVPLSVLPALERIPGVERAIPRIVGAVALGKDKQRAVVLGMPAEYLPRATRLVEGRLYRDGAANELVVGTELARRLHLVPGAVIPPFYQNNRGERLSEVVGVFRSDLSLWQSRLILTSFDTAAAIFAQEGMAGDVLVYCKPGSTDEVREAVRRLFLSGAAGAGTRCRITARSDLEALLPSGLAHQDGIFQLHFLLAFAAAALVLTVSSGIGLPDRRREIGVLKATGWQTDEIILRGAVESFLISTGAASLSLVLAFLWMEGLNGAGIAGLFFPGVGWLPSFRVPFTLSPLPAALGFLFSWILVTCGTLFASWRAAVVSPAEAIR